MARVFAGKLLSDDQGALDEMFLIFTSPLPYNHQSQVVLSYLSHLSALGLATILTYAAFAAEGRSNVHKRGWCLMQGDCSCLKIQRLSTNADG
jgi:hypothetical protein